MQKTDVIQQQQQQQQKQHEKLISSTIFTRGEEGKFVLLARVQPVIEWVTYNQHWLIPATFASAFVLLWNRKKFTRLLKIFEPVRKLGPASPTDKEFSTTHITTNLLYSIITFFFLQP